MFKPIRHALIRLLGGVIKEEAQTSRLEIIDPFEIIEKAAKSRKGEVEKSLPFLRLTNEQMEKLAENAKKIKAINAGIDKLSKLEETFRKSSLEDKRNLIKRAAIVKRKLEAML